MAAVVDDAELMRLQVTLNPHTRRALAPLPVQIPRSRRCRAATRAPQACFSRSTIARLKLLATQIGMRRSPSRKSDLVNAIVDRVRTSSKETVQWLQSEYPDYTKKVYAPPRPAPPSDFISCTVDLCPCSAS